MKTLWKEMTQKSLIQLIVLGVVLVAATATATYLVTGQANHKAPAPAVGPVPQVAQVPRAASSPVQGQPGTPYQPGVLYIYHPTQGFVPVSQPGQGMVPISPYQDARPGLEDPKKVVVKEKVVHVHHADRAAARSSGSRQEGGVLGGLSKTTKGALIGGVLGATGGALMGGRGKHKTANGALVGGAIGTVTGGLLGHAMENK